MEDTLSKTKKDREFLRVEHPDQVLTVGVLDTGRIAFEYQDNKDTISRIRQKQEECLFETYKVDHGRSLLTLGLIDPSAGLSPSLEFWRNFCGTFVHAILANPEIETQRGDVQIDLTSDELGGFLERVPAMTGGERINTDFLKQVWTDLGHVFRSIVRASTESVEGILRELSPGHRLFSGRVHFHLVENKNSSDAPFAFLATYSTHAGKSGGVAHVPLDHALREYGEDTKRLLDLLASVHRAAKESLLMRSLLDSGEIFHPLGFTSGEALQFLREVPLYEDSGVLCRVPKWWTGSPKSISVSLFIGDKKNSEVGKDALLSCRPALHIEGEPLSEAEARDILARFDGLAFIKGKWVEVNREKLKKNLELFEKARSISEKEQFSIGEAMQLLLSNGETGVMKWWEGDIACGAWLESVLERLKNPEKLKPVPVPLTIRAELRPYQRLGLSWLVFFYRLGLGCCLADDMGLGKTLQVLTLLASLKEEPPKDYGPSLLIVPASLIGNWLDEASKFAPDLKIGVAHPQAEEKNGLDRLKENIDNYDFVITTYGMARDMDWLGERQWFYVILDEAQAIKNPVSAQTRAVKMIARKAKRRLILTGTPIENRLGDLWSLFDFLNTGLLGSAQTFKKFANSLEKNPEGYARLRRVVGPCILRRMKTDKSVISDLPEKVEMKAYTGLTRTQALLYKQLQDRFFRDIEMIDEGMKRRGLILSYLLKFKQVCNHPDHYAGSGVYSEKDSGKFMRLRELCETIREKRERVLVFTQFREIIPALDDFLHLLFGVRGVTLDGATPVGERRGIVARFQAEVYVPYFVLSVKAGGTGLNLTRARHVIHFDRWWNPAVETQAEDRAYRIGQTSRVMVHKFICRGTVEEKIDGMIESKKGLAERILSRPEGESWLTELSTKELRDLFMLKLTDEPKEN